MISALLTAFLRTMLSRGMRISWVYDIGAHKGEWSSAMKEGALKGSNFVLFEANPTHRSTLQQTGLKYVCGQMLSDRDDDTGQFYSTGSTGDSYYKEATTWYENVHPVILPKITLNKLVQEYNLPLPDLVKLDTQGSELDILRGATDILKTVSLIYIEVPIIQYNVQAPSIVEYLTFMKDNRFIPVGIFEQHVIESTLIQVDIMYVSERSKNEFLGRNLAIRPLT